MGVFQDLLGTMRTAFKIGRASLDASGLSANRTITIQNTSHTLVGRDTTDTLTNKRGQKRVDSQGSTSTITPEIANFDIFMRTALSGNLTINNHSSSAPANGEMILFWLKDNGTARTISYGTNYENMFAVRPTTTTVGKWTVLLFMWNATDSKFYLMETRTQA